MGTYVNVFSVVNPASNVVVQITDTGDLGNHVIDLTAAAMKQLTGKAYNMVNVNIFTCRAGG
jgi:rare lipoprotein A (peptidoglycan hydrolase)